MKTILFLAGLLLTGGSFAQLTENRANVITLLVDYDNLQFEGGNLASYLCADCNNDSLPFNVSYQSPSDFGSVTFTLSPTGDTVFHGGIVWMGQGELYYSYDYGMGSPYEIQEDIMALPEDAMFYDMQGREISDPQFVNSARNAWYEVNRLEIVETAITEDFRVGIFLYAPTVGVFDPSVAKWVVYLYRNRQLNTLGEPVHQFVVYPNPAKDQIRVDPGFVPLSGYVIRNTAGQILQAGNFDSYTILLTTNTGDGIYFLDLMNGNAVVERIRFLKF